MRNRIRAADRRLPKAVQSLWYSEERIKRERQNSLAKLNHDDDPEPQPVPELEPNSKDNSGNFDIRGNSAELASVFRGRGLMIAPAASSSDAPGGSLERASQTISEQSLRLTVNNADLSASTFADVNLATASFRDVSLAGAVIVDADLRGAHLTDVNLGGATIVDAAVAGLTINGRAIETVNGFGVRFESVSPIGGTDPNALPVKDVGAAVAYYVNVLGFSCVAASASVATLQRDAVEIGLSTNDTDPDQASVYFAVSDIEALHRELTAKSASPSALREDIHGGQRYRVCFAREPYGVCFCFAQKVTTSDT